MLADPPKIDGPTRGRYPLAGKLAKGALPGKGSAAVPVRRLGLEQEFFLVDLKGVPSDLTDPFLRRCREVARTEGTDPGCFGAECVRNLADQRRERYGAWFKAMDLAGVERRLFALAGGNLHGASWNPVRLSQHGTVGIRSMDANFPETVLAVCALVRGVAERVRCERLEVRPSRGVLALEPDGDLLRVPIFSYLNGELLRAAVTAGIPDRRVEAYVDSLVRFTYPYLKEPRLVEPLGTSGDHKNTEREILATFSDRGAPPTREQGLSLVRESCRRVDEQVSALRQRYDGSLPEDARRGGPQRRPDPGLAGRLQGGGL